jgi:hypothetical protein
MITEAVKKKLLGTSASEVPPWQSYDTDLDPMHDASPGLRAAVANKRHHEKTSQQNIEELFRQKEMSTEMVKQYKFYRQDADELGNDKLRRGRVMHCLEFLKRLQTIKPAYLSNTVRKGLIGLAVWMPGEFGGEWKYACGVQFGYCHEYSSLHFDQHGLPLNEKWRGWRTVLLRLIHGGFITEQQADEAFGPALGFASRRYREQLYCWRNRKELDAKENVYSVQ